MELPLSLQSGQFFCSVLVGLIYGLHYDFLRALRRNAKFLTHVLDLWFALTFLVGNFLTALYVGNGQLRIFMFLAIALGMTLWFLLFSRPILWIFGKFWYVLCAPFRLISKICKKILTKMIKFLKNMAEVVF